MIAEPIIIKPEDLSTRNNKNRRHNPIPNSRRTKGDANNAPDDPVNQRQVTGKALFIIPKIGWISIYLKTAISSAWSFLANNPAATYTTLGITLITAALGIHTYRNQPLRRLRRKLKR